MRTACLQLPASSDWHPQSSRTPWTENFHLVTWNLELSHLAKTFSPCQGHQKSVWEASCQGGRLHNHLQESGKCQNIWKQETGKCQKIWLRKEFSCTWDCRLPTPSSQVATLLLMCSSVCLQSVLCHCSTSTWYLPTLGRFWYQWTRQTRLGSFGLQWRIAFADSQSSRLQPGKETFQPIIFVPLHLQKLFWWWSSQWAPCSRGRSSWLCLRWPAEASDFAPEHQPSTIFF